MFGGDSVNVSQGCSDIRDNVFREEMIFHLPDLDVPSQQCFQLNDEKPSCIPSLFCPGTMKSGTSFLYYTLTSHPKIAKSTIKEVNFFVPDLGAYDSGIHAYSTHFIHDPSQIIVDMSPKYMMRAESAEMAYSVNPNARFIVMLRDPVDRSYSHYRFQQGLYNNVRHREELANSSCPNRIKNISFKQYINEEYNLMQACNLVPWATPVRTI